MKVGLNLRGQTIGELTAAAQAAEAARAAAGHIAFYATVRTYAEFFEFHGFGSQTRGVREAFRAGDVEGMIDCVTDEMVQTLTLTGTAGEVRDRLRQFAGMVDLLRLSAPHHFQSGEVTRAYQQRIIGELASL